MRLVSRPLSATVSASRRYLFQSAFMWGSGSNGQLTGGAQAAALGDKYNQLSPVKIDRNAGFTDIACGELCTVAIDGTGELLFWGKDPVTEKQIWTPKPIMKGLKFKAVAAGLCHAAAISTEGDVYTWGKEGGWFRGGGWLGHGSKTNCATPTLMEHFKSYGAKAKSVVCSAANTFILTQDGEVLACGTGEYGRLGTGDSSDALVPATVSGLLNEDIIQIAAGHSHTLALTKDGRVFGWGRNESGQLGLEDSFIDMYSMENVPRIISPSHFTSGDSGSTTGKVVKIATGKGRSAAVTNDGKLYVWGHRIFHMPRLIYMSPNTPAEMTPFVVDVACGCDTKPNVAMISKEGHLWTMGILPKTLAIDPAEGSRNDEIRHALGQSKINDPAIVPRVVIDPLHPLYSVTKVALGFGLHGAVLVTGRG